MNTPSALPDPFVVTTTTLSGIITPFFAMYTAICRLLVLVKETVTEMKRIFVDKEKMLEKKYWDILEEVLIKYYKGYEHEKIKEVSGKDVDRLLKNSEEYLKKLKELRTKIELYKKYSRRLKILEL